VILLYISASRSMRAEAETLAGLIEAAVPGAVVSPRWWTDIPNGDDRDVPEAEAMAIAQEQAIAVLSSDVFVYLSSPRGDGQGTNTELGLALAGQHLQGAPVVIGVGKHVAQSIFNRLTTKWVGNWDAAVDAVREVGEM